MEQTLSSISLYVAFGLMGVGIVHFIISLIATRWRSANQVKEFDGPAPHWLKGNVKDITFDGRGLAFHLKCASLFKTAYRVWFGPFRSALIVCHPDTAGAVLIKNSPKERFFYKFLFPFLGNGLGLQEGQQWESTRKLLTPSFHFKILQRYFPVFQESTQILMGKWSRAANGKVELFQDISLMTLDSILKCAFSYSSACQTRKIQDEYIAAVNGIARALLDRLLNPLYHFEWIYKLTPARRKFLQYCDVIHRESNKVISSRRESRAKASGNNFTKQRYLDFLDILLEAKDENGNGLSDEDILAQVNTFMFAGHDTVASALCWALYSLASNVKHQRLCQQEIDEAINNNQHMTWEGIASLSYLDRCIKESMRLYAPVPVIARTLDEPYTIDGKLAPEGTFVLANIYALHRNPHVWENPKEFNPDRFLPEKCKERSMYSFIPFSLGPRICIGKNFGMQEIKTSLVMILQKFNLSVDPQDSIDDMDLFPELVLRSKSGVHIRITPRGSTL
ncbi:cytochrome P450 4B1 [Exaiptasia diaphana]|uniref:Cytochrome P450 n=1 Tax=Exaiptasia diaphana TaxID=2652724 RepID=A0A913WRB0_EXADI|nr:cytochrome P450 4B1 [Exaiptasia diaphana]XP_028512830.1 cytochrome P450 4B1 [Exaiptasia diaphana]KXJ18513.1 Phylloquinone omega-hydroxylase CYP4F2 [Exaiptasia diaphana]